MADDDRPLPKPTQPPIEPENPLLTDSSEKPDEALMNDPGPTGSRAPFAITPAATKKEESLVLPPKKRTKLSSRQQKPPLEQHQSPPEPEIAGRSSGPRKRAATYPQTQRPGSKTSVQDRKVIATLHNPGKVTIKNLAKMYKCTPGRIKQICAAERARASSTATQTLTTTITTRATINLTQQQPPPELQQQPPPEQQQQPSQQQQQRRSQQKKKQPPQ